MLMELYYEHYVQNCCGRYWEEQKSIPYMVLFDDGEKMMKFRDFLLSEGFRAVTGMSGYPGGVLVNMELRRFGQIFYACKYSCVNDRNYTPEEFMNEVYNKYH